MKKRENIKKFSEYILKVLKINKKVLLKKQLNIFNNIDSIEVFNVIIKLEKKYKLKINLDKMNKANTIEKLYKFLTKNEI